jgi:rhodanese-related sulfurtransferase
MRYILFALAAIVMIAATAFPSSSGPYSYISAQDLNRKLGLREGVILIDLSPAPLFSQRHIPGSIETGAYPVETPVQIGRLEKVLQRIVASSDEIVLICPKGGGSARRAFEHLKSKGVNPERIRILEGGILAWPYKIQRTIETKVGGEANPVD